METFERIVQALEGIEKALQLLTSRQPSEQRVEQRASELIQQYGQYVDKTVAARILGVTRATVYAMLADGQITGAYGGKQVDVQSIAAYMTSTKSGGGTNAESARHGRWIHDINNLYACSECLGREAMPHKRLKPYCPNCGAKMDGSENNAAD